MDEPLILIVGAADTGRAPMAAALLRRLLRRAGLRARVESAGVVGHDSAPAEPEARDAMLAMGLSLAEHAARSLDDALAAEARLLLAVDAGVARVLRARHPAAAAPTLGELAGRARNIPDPFRMQVGAWLQYAAEIEALLQAGMPRLRELLEAQGDGGRGDGGAREQGDGGTSVASERLPPSSAERVAAVERAARLLALVAELPDVVEWQAATRQLAADLSAAEAPVAAGDLARSYVALLRATLAALPDRPGAARALALRGAVERLRAPIGPAELEALAGELGP